MKNNIFIGFVVTIIFLVGTAWIYSEMKKDIEQKNCSSGMIDKCDWGECAAHREITKEN